MLLSDRCLQFLYFAVLFEELVVQHRGASCTGPSRLKPFSNTPLAIVLLTTRQFEAADASLPAGCAGLLASESIVLVHIPKRAVVCGIDRQICVVTPARVRCPLDSATIDNRAFAQSHLAKRVASEPATVANPRKDVGAIHDAVAEGHVTILILRDTTHPAVDTIVGSGRSRLVKGVATACTPDVVPADTGHSGKPLHRQNGHQRLVSAKVPVGEAEGRALAVGQDVKKVIGSWRDPRLGKAVAARLARMPTAGEDRIEACDRKLRLEDDGRSRVCLPRYAEFPNVKRVGGCALRGVIVLRTDNRRGGVLRRFCMSIDIRRQ